MDDLAMHESRSAREKVLAAAVASTALSAKIEVAVMGYIVTVEYSENSRIAGSLRFACATMDEASIIIRRYGTERML